MNKEELLQFARENKDNFSIQLKRHHREVYDKIDSMYDFPKFGEKLYSHIYGHATSSCEVCGAPCKFDGFHKGYRKRCSYKCLAELKKVAPIKKICPVCELQFETDSRHNRLTCSTECMLKYVKTDEVKNRQQKNTKLGMLAKYGVEYAGQLPNFSKKLKETKLKNHGDENYVNPEKAKQTRLSRYGSENYNNIEKFKETFISKYGVDNPSKVDSMLDKVKAKKIEHFGGSGVSPLVLSKLKERLDSGSVGFGSETFNKKMVDLYGTSNPTKNREIAKQVGITQKELFYGSLLSGLRLGDTIPLFSKEEYTGTRLSNDKMVFYPFKCKICSHEFSASIEDGKIPVCHKCHPTGRSRCEIEVFEFVKSILPQECEIISNDRQLISPLEIDIYIPEKKLAIEFDGVIWHSENFGDKPRNYHLTKTQAAGKRGVKLIHIFEHEWMTRQDIIKRKISACLGVVGPSKKIYGRKCIIKEITPNVCSEFLRMHHIQGNDKSSVKLGAIYEEKLVAVMTFGKERVALGTKKSSDGNFEMYRFAVGDSPVIGIGGKLFSHFLTNYNPTKVTTFADIRYSGLSAFYEKIGFTYLNPTPPNYYYFNIKDPLKLFHRFSFRKNVLSKKLANFNPEISEWENMKLHGYDRIWDCGNLKYVWTKPITT